MTRICVLCLGDHASFECSINDLRKKTTPQVFKRPETKTQPGKGQTDIKSFCIKNPTSFVIPSAPMNQMDPRAGNGDVIFVRTVLPATPIPHKIEPVKVEIPSVQKVDKATDPMILGSQLITLEEHEAIIMELLSRDDPGEPEPLEKKKKKKKRSPSPTRLLVTTGTYRAYVTL